MTGLLLALLTASPDDKNAAAAAAAQEAMAAAQKLQDAKQRAESACAPLENRPVELREEKYIGQRFAAAALGKALKGPLADYVQRVGDAVARASSRKDLGWTFAVVDDGASSTSSEMGGWVFVTTGLLARLSNEAELAAALAHEIAHVAGNERVATFARARFVACRTALAGYTLTEASAAGVPGGDDFVRNAKFGETMRAFASRDGVAMYDGPNVDQQFITWYLQRVQEMQRMSASVDSELAADALAVKLLAAAGYETKALGSVIRRVDVMNGQPRTEAVEKLPQKKGKAPAFPNQLQWPK